MEINVYRNKLSGLIYNFFKWRYEINIFYKITLALGFACLTGIFAQVRFHIPGTPVPITGQVFCVLLAGVILGKWGGISQSLYIGAGLLGVPWFTGFNSGFIYLFGPTGGYLIGFILSAFFIGFIVDRYLKARNFSFMLLIMLFSIFILIYIPGLTMFYFWTGTSIQISELLILCVFPFLIADFIKALSVAFFATVIMPKRSYGQEVDI